MKTFFELLAEKDDEFTHYLRSTADIHHPELFERVRLSFMPFRVKSIEPDSYRPISRDNPDFPDEPNSPTYSIKIVTGLPLTPKFLEGLAMEAHIHIAHLKLEGEDDHELVNKPVEVQSSDAQNLVGQKRLGEFVRELEADRKKRMGMTTERKVYESFSTTHRGLEGVVKKPMRKGYYMIEAYHEDGRGYLSAKGPFPSRPEGNYHDRIIVNNPRIVAEQSTSESYNAQIAVED